MAVRLLFLVILAQATGSADDWIRLTPHQTEGSAVKKLTESTTPALKVCREVVFEVVVTEAQFTVIVVAVVDRAGQIQRFRIVRELPFMSAVTKTMTQALAAWRYEPMKANQPGDAFEITIAVFKPAGATHTSTCKGSAGPK